MMSTVARLSGGTATRLYPVTKAMPKAMLELAGKPFIAHQIEILKNNGVGRVVICAGYLGHVLKEYVQDGSDFGLTVDFSFDGDKLLGTAGAINKALPLLGDNFAVMYGDSPSGFFHLRSGGQFQPKNGFKFSYGFHPGGSAVAVGFVHNQNQVVQF